MASKQHSDDEDNDGVDECERGIDFGALQASAEAVRQLFPPLLERYAERRFFCPPGDAREDQWVCHHHNGLALVGLAPSHPALQRARGGVVRVEWAPAAAESRPVGKCKRGARAFRACDALCTLTTADGATFRPVACVRGLLLETNARVAADPALLCARPATEAYLAVLSPPFGASREQVQAGLLDTAAYCALRGVPERLTTADPQQ